MYSYYKIVFITAIYTFDLKTILSLQDPATTINVHERVALLKYQIEKEIARNRNNSEKIYPIETTKDEYLYDDDDNTPITPIMDSDKNKIYPRFRHSKRMKIHRTTNRYRPPPTKPMNQLRKKKKKNLRHHTVKPSKIMPINVSVTKNGAKIKRIKKHKLVKMPARNKKRYPKYSDIFYRRAYSNVIKDHDYWVHCQDLITPYFLGHKTDVKDRKRIPHDDFVVLRLVQLLEEVTSTLTKEDIYSILYQINNLQLRFFQWDPAGLTKLLETLVKDPDKKLNFKTIKIGLKQLFDYWRLDTTDTTNILKSAKIFRPPCVKVSEYEGSTKTSLLVTYPTKRTVKSTCINKDLCNDDESE